jgi:transposase
MCEPALSGDKAALDNLCVQVQPFCEEIYQMGKDIKIKQHDKRTRQANRIVPKRVISDKCYDDDGLRNTFADKGIDLIVPYRNNRVRRPYEDGRKRRRYKRCWKVDRTNTWYKNFRRVAVRWDRRWTAYKGGVHIACICITLMKFGTACYALPWVIARGNPVGLQ